MKNNNKPVRPSGSSTALRRGLSLSALCLGLAACGSITDPDPKEVTDLKPVLDLEAVPVSNGDVLLTWTANNAEESFSGYSIYLSQDDPATFVPGLRQLGLAGTEESDPHKLSPLYMGERDGFKEKVLSVIGSHFVSTAGAKPAAEDKSPISPRVRCILETEGAQSCTVVTEPKESAVASGPITFVLSGLDPSRPATVFVLATSDSGKEVAEISSPVLIVRPQSTNTAPSDLQFVPPSAGARYGLDLAALSSPDQAKMLRITPTKESLYCTGSPADGEDGPLVDVYFEQIGNEWTLAPANGARLAKLGPVVSADSLSLVAGTDAISSPLRLGGTGLLPPVESGSDGLSLAPDAADTGAAFGYSRCGQSEILEPNALYAIAFLDRAAVRYALLSVGAFDPVKGPEGKDLLFSVGRSALFEGAPAERRL